MKLPAEYRGVLVEKRVQEEDCEKKAESAKDQEEERTEAGILDVKAEFDEAILWGHESVVDASGDPYARGLEEWVGVAGRVSWRITSQDN